MIIDSDRTTGEHTEGSKGGEGRLDVRAFVDDQMRIIYSTLHPGVSSGKHQHVGSLEVTYVINGELTAHYDDTTEAARVGQLHYYPEEHSRWSEDYTDHDAVYLAIVPTLR